MFSNCQKAFGEFLSHYTIFGGFETNIWPHSLIFFFRRSQRPVERETELVAVNVIHLYSQKVEERGHLCYMQFAYFTAWKLVGTQCLVIVTIMMIAGKRKPFLG